MEILKIIALLCQVNLHVVSKDDNIILVRKLHNKCVTELAKCVSNKRQYYDQKEILKCVGSRR